MFFNTICLKVQDILFLIVFHSNLAIQIELHLNGDKNPESIFAVGQNKFSSRYHISWINYLSSLIVQEILFTVFLRNFARETFPMKTGSLKIP